MGQHLYFQPAKKWRVGCPNEKIEIILRQAFCTLV